jgi:excisionase family DNA binding protein
MDTPVAPSQFSSSDERLLVRVQQVLQERKRPALVSSSGEQIEFPDALFDWMVHAVDQMSVGKSAALIPEHDLLTTQAAANVLGVSRPHLVKMLEAGEIPFEKVGTHRRIRFGDVMSYARSRSERRRAALSEWTAEVEAAGLYDR